MGGSAVADHLYLFGWWFRLAGATQESIFGVPDIESYIGDESCLAWTGLGSGAFDACESIRVLDASLDDTLVTTFNNSGLPFGPGDVTAGDQFPLQPPANGSTTLRLYLEVEGVAFHCNSIGGVVCDSFEVGSTAVWSAHVP